jgi:hypothetical protein
MLFKGLTNLSHGERIEELKKYLSARGEAYNEDMLNEFEKNPKFTLKKMKKETKKCVRRKSADYLRKYDYRKLNFEIKKLQKK